MAKPVIESIGCPCGGSRWDHRRLRDATYEAARLREENRILAATLEEVTRGVDMPLWRRIACQRREIKAAWFYADMYRKWWRRDMATESGVFQGNRDTEHQETT